MKKIISLLIIFILILGFSSSSMAEEVNIGDPISAGMPDIEEVYSKEYNDNIFMTDYKENYSIDVNAGTFDLVDKMLTQVVNILFSLQRALVQALIFMFDKALSFSSYALFDNILENFISGMYRSTFGVVGGILLAFLGLYFFIKMIQNRQVEFWTGLAKTVVVIAIATLYFTNPLFLAEKVELASNELTKMVISTGSKKQVTNYLEAIEESKNKESGKKQEVITIIANDLWTEYVHKPWRIMEFGNNKVADGVDDATGLKWEESVLKQAENIDEREATIERMESITGISTESMVTKRLGFMLMYLVPLTVNILLMALFCIAIIGLQFFVTLVFVLGVFVFIVALIPSFGMETVKRWGISIAFLSGMKIVLAFILMVMLTFNRALYETASEDGWIYALILQLAIYVVMYVFREKIFNIFAIAKEVAANPSKAIERIKRHGELNPHSNYGQKMFIRNPKNPRVGVAGTYRGMKNYVKEWKEAKSQRKETINYMAREYGNSVEIERSKKYLDKKYNFKKKKLAKLKPTEYSKDVAYVNKIDNRVAKGKDKWAEYEINEVKLKRKRAKEYIEYRKNRAEGKVNKKFESSYKKQPLPRYIPGGRSRAKKLRRYYENADKE